MPAGEGPRPRRDSSQGREAALRFAAEAASVVGGDTDAAAAADALSAFRDVGLDADIAVNGIDLGEPEQARGWVEGAADRDGRIDVVYNNASAARFGSIAELSVEDWRFTIRNELNLVFFVTKYAWPILVRSGGGTVNNAVSAAQWTGNRSVPFVAQMASKGWRHGDDQTIGRLGKPAFRHIAESLPKPMPTDATRSSRVTTALSRSALAPSSFSERRCPLSHRRFRTPSRTFG